MALDAERLADDLGVDVGHIQHAEALEEDALAENVGTIAAETVHGYPYEPGGRFVVLDATRATNTLLALENTDWNSLEPGDRAEATVYLLRILRMLGLTPYDVEAE